MVTERDPAGVFPLVARLLDAGADLAEFLNGTGEMLRALMMLQVGVDPEEITESLRAALEEYKTAADRGRRAADAPAPRRERERRPPQRQRAARGGDAAAPLDDDGPDGGPRVGHCRRGVRPRGPAAPPRRRRRAIVTPAKAGVPASAARPTAPAVPAPRPPRAANAAPATGLDLDALIAAWEEVVVPWSGAGLLSRRGARRLHAGEYRGDGGAARAHRGESDVP